MSGPLAAIRAGLVARLDARLVEELLAAYVEAKENFYAGGLRLSAVEGGRFCEAAFRLLQQACGLPITPLGKQLKTDEVIKALASVGAASAPESVRLHIPRALRVVYDVRNKRDAAHLADGIDPNLQDATLVATVIDWVLAEFVRLYHNVTPDEAQRLVETLVTRRAPAVQSFGSALKVLNPRLRAGETALVLLYHRGAQGATRGELEQWMPPAMRANLSRTLSTLEDGKAFVHRAGDRYLITLTGIDDVQRRMLYKLPG